jgi:hypothetical protein
VAGDQACQNFQEERYAMEKSTDIIALRQRESVDDPLTAIARDGARRMLAATLRAEADAFVAEYAEDLPPDGRQRVVRHGYGPERSTQTGIGALDVQRPNVRDRATDVPADQKIRFTSAILPKWACRSRSLDALLPVPVSARHLDRRLPGSTGREPDEFRLFACLVENVAQLNYTKPVNAAQSC